MAYQFIDFKKKEWVKGDSVGRYDCDKTIRENKSRHLGFYYSNNNHVLKIESRNNDPLFCEFHFYSNVCKAELSKNFLYKFNCK